MVICVFDGAEADFTPILDLVALSDLRLSGPCAADTSLSAFVAGEGSGIVIDKEFDDFILPNVFVLLALLLFLLDFVEVVDECE